MELDEQVCHCSLSSKATYNISKELTNLLTKKRLISVLMDTVIKIYHFLCGKKEFTVLLLFNCFHR